LSAYDYFKGLNDPEVRAELCCQLYHMHMEALDALNKPRAHFSVQELQSLIIYCNKKDLVAFKQAKITF
jgi:hypothetical protein